MVLTAKARDLRNPRGSHLENESVSDAQNEDKGVSKDVPIANLGELLDAQASNNERKKSQIQGRQQV